LNEHGIDVRRSMRRQLSRCDFPSYEGDITSWHSQDRLLLAVVA
jgi:hypothetical protein